MMPAVVSEHYTLGPEVATAPLVALMVAAACAWAGLHALAARIPWRRVRLALAALRFGVGFGAMLLLFQLLQRWVILTTDWWLWPIALLAAGSVELVAWLYAPERRGVSRRTSVALLAGRVALVLLAAVMLTQPVRRLDLTREIRRRVAVLIDESASMRVSDRSMPPAQRIRLAEMLGPGRLRRHHRLEEVAEDMDAVARAVSRQARRLGMLADMPRDKQAVKLAAWREGLRAELTGHHEALSAVVKRLEAALVGGLKLDERTRQKLADAKSSVAVGARDRLAEAARITETTDHRRLVEQQGRLMEALRNCAATLEKHRPEVIRLGEAVDEAVYASLPADIRARIDSVAETTRLALARQVLLAPEPSAWEADAQEGLLQTLDSEYSLRMYTFSGRAAEADPQAWQREQAEAPSTAPTSAPVTQPADLRRTDLAAALRKVASDSESEELAGVLVLTDGRHNAPDRPEPVARKLGLRGAPVCFVALGCDMPPLDAAVVSAEAPQTICAKDKVYVTCQVKLDGLAGKKVRVSLLDGDRQVDSSTVTPPSDAWRTRVRLADEPKTAGMHAYRVRVQRFDNEAFDDNNDYTVSVAVSDERTKLLIIEGRPRWEFRYLKNLFASRDSTVSLQYVLLEPDRVESQKPRATVAASAANPPDVVEATVLPAGETEWLKFDVIVLGDVAPNSLGAEALGSIEKFVTERGGTLIVISGERHVPCEYADTGLARLLPVRLPSAEGAAPAMSGESFRIALTAEGRDHVIMQLSSTSGVSPDDVKGPISTGQTPEVRQRTDPDENLRVWNSIPPIYRRTVAEAAQGATVLAYALTQAAPKPDADDAETLGRVRDYERRNALITAHNVAAGKVLFLAFDRTWRLRYRVGDTYHHRFWGQVMRWATENKLPAGSTFVRIGTGRARYAPDEPVRVTARIVRRDFTPVRSDEVAVRVFKGPDEALRRKLEYVPDSPGLYTASLGTLAPGTYRVELDAPVAEPILAADNMEKVWTEVSVAPADRTEQVELSSDRGLMGAIAGQSGGMVTEPARAHRVREAFGGGTEVRREGRDYSIWDSWPLLVLIVTIAAAEWIIRKRAGLP